MAKDNRPLFLFDFGARETEETLRTRLLLEAELCLTTNGRPIRQMLDDLRGYIVKNKSSDARVYPILRIVNRYLNVTPTDFQDLVQLLGWDKALEFIDGVRPPDRVWQTLTLLREEGASPEYVEKFWTQVLDAIERGEQSIYWYIGLCHDYVYTYRNLKPGYRLARS